ncbi:MAG: vitamin K epoxide reductase family protein [Anaerolineae bacterium]
MKQEIALEGDLGRTGKVGRVAVSLLAGAGMMISAYLTYVHFAGGGPLCAGVGDCEAVNTSIYSELGGIPVALLGFGMYALILFIVLLRRAIPGNRLYEEWFSLVPFGLSLVGTLYSAYLTYIELFVLRAICPWCVASALIITAILGLFLWDLLTTGQIGEKTSEV